jgi:hypothetical protein
VFPSTARIATWVTSLPLFRIPFDFTAALMSRHVSSGAPAAASPLVLAGGALALGAIVVAAVVSQGSAAGEAAAEGATEGLAKAAAELAEAGNGELE